MAMLHRGFRGEEYATLMSLVLNGMADYHPFVEDVDNEVGAN